MSDTPEVQERVRDALEQRCVKEPLQRYLEAFWESRDQSSEEFHELGVVVETIMHVPSVDLRSNVIDQLGTPCPIDMGDLIECAREQLFAPAGDFDSTYARFVSSVCSRIPSFRDRRERCLIDTRTGLLQGEIHFTKLLEWNSGEVVIGADLPIPWDEYTPPYFEQPSELSGFRSFQYSQIVCDIVFQCSAHALERFRVEIEPLTRSAFLSARYAQLVPGAPEAPADEVRAITSRLYGFVTWLIGSFYTRPPKKGDAIPGKRVRNAMFLLMAGDGADNYAIGISLFYSALEALVCNKPAGIADELSSHVATLLQPDRHAREDVIRAVKRGYNDRSRLLHGERIEVERERAFEARVIASGVLYAMWEWYECMTRLDPENATAEQFIGQLRSASVSGSTMTGVTMTWDELMDEIL